MLIRCIILKVKKDYYIAQHNYSKKKYKIIRNENICELNTGADHEFYCIKKVRKMMKDILIPISEEQAFSMKD